MRTGIFGGSFDPPHNYHSYIIRKSIELLELDRLLVIPAGIQPLKESGAGAGNEARLAMLRSFVVRLGGEVSDIEMKRGGVSYTVDTLEALKDEGDLVMIIGADTAFHLDLWKDYKRVMSMAEIAVFPRKGYPYGMIREKWDVAVNCLEVDAADISSTTVRGYIKEGKDISGLVPAPVYDIIRREGLYGWEKRS